MGLGKQKLKRLERMRHSGREKDRVPRGGEKNGLEDFCHLRGKTKNQIRTRGLFLYEERLKSK